MKTFLRFTGILLLTAGILIFGGCPEDQGENKVNPKLVGEWSNEETDEDNLRTFSIKANGSFTASLNPGGNMGKGMVKGVLIEESGNDYIMNKMKETTGTDWGSAVGLYDQTPIQITLSNNDNTFTLTCDVSAVETFFGGTYHRQQ